MKDNPIKDKSMAFAIRIVNLYKYLAEKNEFVMSKQILRSGTSIGANIAEAIRAESNNDFIHKLSISRKEAQETIYWLELLHKTVFIPTDAYNSICSDCEELAKMLTSIILSSKQSSDSNVEPIRNS